jgi:ribosomal-protein-alanine N-acetyltransferase
MIRLEVLLQAGASTARLSLAELHGRCFPDDPWDAEAINAIAAMPGFFGRLAWLADETAGLALALDLGEDCEILALGVRPQQRREGIGRALLQSLCREARQRGRRAVLLEVAADNVGARALYDSAGFRVIGRRGNYYRRGGQSVDALVLRLPCDSREDHA